MSKIIIGKSGNRNVQLDVDALLRTRALVQANSGKGKSWLLRRIAEQLFGKIQVIIIDPEGEFATLREKFGYVLVGKGGETPADPRSAALVAHKLLELRASAVCDLYEMKPATRHEWVARFLDSMIDAPKNLWHPCVVMVDEAHVYCPEKGAGESQAAEAMIGLATRGRKRGFAALFATQRLGKLRKDAAAELLNVLIGGTFIDIDRKRAADALGVYGKDQHKFFDEIKVMERGTFFALGPAISNERILVKVGAVETTHPEAGSAKHAAEPPPAPEKVKAMLPKLADLPKTAEEKAKTEAELRREIRELKAALRTAQLPVAVTKTREVRVADPRAIERAVRDTKIQYDAGIRERDRAIKELHVCLSRIITSAGRTVNGLPKFKSVHVILPKVSGAEIQTKGEVVETREAPATHRREPQKPSHPLPNYESNGDSELTPYQRSMLNALADLELIGKTEPSWPLVGAAAGKSSGSSTFERYAAQLRSAGLIDYPQSNRMRLTEEGRSRAKVNSQPLSSEEIQERALQLLTPYQADILRALIAAHPESLAVDELGVRSGKAHGSSTFERYLASLTSMEMIERPRPKAAKAADWLFLE